MHGGKRAHRCSLCAQTHSKCDGQVPCSRCIVRATSRQCPPGTLCFYDSEAGRLVEVLHAVTRNTASLVGAEEKDIFEERLQKRRRLEREIEERQSAAARKMQFSGRSTNMVNCAHGLPLKERNHSPPHANDLRVPIEQLRAAFLELIQSAGLSCHKMGQTSFGGNGGVGCVWPKEHPARKVALKFSQPRLRGVDDRERIRRELMVMQLATGLPHVVQLTRVQPNAPLGTFLESNGCIAGIVMEWVPSVTLSAAAQVDSWWDECAVQCIAGIVSGVRGLHSRLIIHGDIKPINVMIHTDLLTVTIVDLGASTMCTGGTPSYGTAGYRAPENPRGDERKFSSQARALDYWAVGVTALHFVCGTNCLSDPADSSTTQDGLLHKLARAWGEAGGNQSSPWSAELAHKRCAGRGVVQSSIFKWIDNMMSAEPAARSLAMQEFEKTMNFH
jgi:hypothetical protein